jgi:hypothetical protein
MKRSTVLATFVLAAMIAIVGVFAAGLSHRGISAQDTSTEDHPLVGTWLTNTDPQMAGEYEPMIFHADGTYVDVEVGGDVLLGTWEATGATTAILTIQGFEADDEGTVGGGITIRASIEVSEDGNTFTGQYTIEFINADGSSTGEAGPGEVTGTRMPAEAPGTPVMSLDELFGSFEGAPQASPEATPTS